MKSLRIVFILVALGTLNGQNPPRVPQAFLIAPKTSFVWGESNTLSLRVTNSQGISSVASTVSWFVDPPGVATIDRDGNVIPARLQTFVVRGTDANTGLSAEIALQILPKKIVVIPERSAMTVGSTQTLRAEALDINDRPIPNINFQWRLQNLIGYWDSNYPMARIDVAGRLTSLVQGRLRAIAVVPYASNRWLPTFLNEATGETPIDLEVLRTYTFERLLESKPISQTSRLTPKAAALLSTEDDGFVFSASLSNVTSALLEWKAGRVTPLLSAGRSHSSTRQPLIEFTSYARNHRGEMLTEERDAQGGTQVSTGPALSQLPLLVPGTPVNVAERTWGFDIQRNSLADSGYKTVYTSYQDAVTHESTQGLFRGMAKGVEELVIGRLDDLPGRPNSGFWFDSYGITNDGTVWFLTNDSILGQALWKKGPLSSIEKVIAPGDSFQTDRVSGLGVPFVSSSGEVVTPVYTNRTGCFFRWPAGDPTPQTLCGVQTSNDAVYWNEPGVGAVLKTNYNNQGSGLYLWNNDGVSPLLRFSDRIDGSPITDIYSATINSHGVAFAMVATADSALLIMRIRPDRQVVLREDDEFAFSLPPAISGLIPGRGTSPARAIVGGFTGSIAEITSDGTLQPLVAVGDILPTGSHYRGSRIDVWAGGQTRSLADGSVVFVDSSGVHQWRNNTVETLYRLPGTISGIQLQPPWNIDANASGQIAAHIYSGADTGIYRLSNGTATLAILQKGKIDNETVAALSTPAIDDQGRIAFRFQNDDGDWNFVGLWDGTRVSKILYPGMSMPDGRTIRSLDRLQASSDAFTAKVNLSDSSTLIRYRNGGWEYVISRTDQIATGSVVNWVDTFGLNGPGDVSFLAGQHLEAKRGTVFHEIHDLGTSTDEDEFLLAISDLHLNDDGTLYVLASTDLGQQVVYRATPGAPPSPAVETRSFTLNARGSVSTNTTGRSTGLATGFAGIQPDTGKNTPAGLAIFGLRKDGVLVTEAGVPAVTVSRSGRFFAEAGNTVNTGLAIANPSNEVAAIQFYVTDENGAVAKSGTVTVGAKSQIAEFLDGPDFKIGPVRGTFTFTSSVGVGVTALRGLTNEQGNFLITTLPVADLSPITGNQYLPHFAIGQGWTTQLILVNPTDSAINGSFAFFSEGTNTSAGAALTLSVNGQSADSFRYSIPARSMRRYVPTSSSASLLSGFVLVSPSNGSTAPSSLAVFSLRNSSTTVSEAGVSGSPVGTAFRMYAEMSGSFSSGERGSISTGIAVANTTSMQATVSVELINADGVSTGLTGTMKVPASGKVSTFLYQIPGLDKVSLPFTGTIRLTSNSPVSVLGLRGRYNEVSSFLFTTTPAIPEGLNTREERVFPHLADGAGYTTQFILMDTGSTASGGSLRFFNQQGQPLPIRLQN